MTRKRQLEIELGLHRPGPGGKGKATKPGELNFFVDSYSDEQIQEIISIFRNDFKPPKNLWIEKQPSPYALGSGGAHSSGNPNQQQNLGSNSPDYYLDIFADAIDQFNQHQAQLQQQQQAQLQQQVASGSSQGSSSAPGSQLSATSGNDSTGSSNSPKAARRSPQPSGRMLDQLEDDLVRKAEEEHQARKSRSSVSSASEGHNNSVGSTNSQGKAESEPASLIQKQLSDPVKSKT